MNIEPHTEPFLKLVAEYYSTRRNLENSCFIFPNRRAMVFFRHYLAQTLKGGRQEAVRLPDMTTINEFFYKACRAETTDRTTLLIELYDVYRNVYKEKNQGREAEPLDEFIFWGDTILADFNDVDKYLIDARQLFFNISDLNDIQSGWIDELSESQAEAIRNFLACFTHSANAGGGKKLGVKDSFLSVWNLLYDVYERYNVQLKEKGQSYEGMVYRNLADSLRESNDIQEILAREFGDDKYVFVGLNVLNECEKTLLTSMKNVGLAEFAWDYYGNMIQDKDNKSSLFMGWNVRKYPDPEDAPWKDGGTKVSPEINVVAVPSAVGQAKLLGSIFKRFNPVAAAGNADSGTDAGGGASGNVSRLSWMNTAVVLPDESMLAPVLNSIPEEIDEINVTMGIPMSESAIFSFMEQVCRLQLKVTANSRGSYFYHKVVWEIFANALFARAVTEAEAEKIREVKKEAKLYIPMSDLVMAGETCGRSAGNTLGMAGDGAYTATMCSDTGDSGGKIVDMQHFALLNAVFRLLDISRSRINPEGPGKSLADIDLFAEYLMDVLKVLVSRLLDVEEMSLQIEYAKAYYCALELLRGRFREINEGRQEKLVVTASTFAAMLKQLTAGITVPFRGEPLKGLQIMGPLETRCLDFENVVLMSAMEGVFPRKTLNASFIPSDLRLGYGMPTYEYHDAVWAYYFYRMISRAKNVWILFDSRTEGVKSGEESRYVKQLKYHFECPINRVDIAYPRINPVGIEPILKPDNIEEIVKNKELSASQLKNYLICPAKFYYSFVKDLTTDDELEENLTAASFGNVFHPAMQEIYNLPERMKITDDFYRDWFAREEKEGAISAIVKTKIMETLNTVEIRGRNIIDEKIVREYVMKTLERDREMLKALKRDSFEILGREVKFKFDIEAGASDKPQRFKGFIDRLDTLTDEADYRVVDYKTGAVRDSDRGINDENAEARSELLFGGGKDAPSIAFQFYIYDMMLREGWWYSKDNEYLGRFMSGPGKRIQNSVYSTVDIMKRMPKNEAVSEKFYECVKRGLVDTLNEIYDTQTTEFERTENTQNCSFCSFKSLCGR